MGLFEKKVTLSTLPDPRLQGALGLQAPARVLFTPIVDGRPPQAQGSVGDFKNLFGMTLGRCLLAQGEPTAVVGEAVFKGLAAAGFAWVGLAEPSPDLVFHGRLDALWGDGKVQLTGIVEATCAMSLQLAQQGRVVYERPYYGLGRAESAWAVTQGIFQEALTKALTAMVWYVGTDQALGAAVRSALARPT